MNSQALETTRAEIDRKKRQKRQALHMERMRNLKKAVRVMVLLLVVLAIGNHYYKNYEEKIYGDKRVIMSSNRNKVYQLSNDLGQFNRVLVDLLENDIDNKSLIQGKIKQLAISTRDNFDFRYDYTDYRIDDYNAENYVTGMAQTLVDALEAEHLSEGELKKLAALLTANLKIQEDIQAIQEVFWHGNGSEALNYLYFYKGEAYYLLINAIDVHSASVELYFMETERQVPEEALPSGLSVQEMADLMALLNDQVFDGVYDVTDYTIHYMDDATGASLAYAIERQLNRGGQTINFYVDNMGQMYFANDTPEADLKPYKDLLEPQALRDIADQYVSLLEEPLLTYEGSHESTYAIEVFGGIKRQVSQHSFSYYIADAEFKDKTSYVSVTVFGNGSLRSMNINDPSLLTGTYAVKARDMTQEQAIAILEADGPKNILSIQYELSGTAYYVIDYTEYGLGFTARIHVDSKEIEGILAYLLEH